MSGRGREPKLRTDGRPVHRLSQAETIRRQQAIAKAREVDRLSWAETAARVGMGEKEARESYRRYREEIVPLLIAVPATGKAAELLDQLDDIRQQQLRIAVTSCNDSARVGALRDATKTVQIEFEIRRALGLMPNLLGDAELRRIAEQIIDVLAYHGAAAELIEEIVHILTTEAETG